ncbi:MAG: SDR family oxidoreductase, partial [Leptospira sp.]|nr:SDR family oxidoreductase [Leptospira sp.]
STNLSNNDAAYKELHKLNYEATVNLLKCCLPFTKKFIFISTAFSVGHREGLIENNYNSKYTKRENRNPYEALKWKAEHEIMKICEENGIVWQILRPGIICGRLIDAPLYFTPTFNVFYAAGKFFHFVSNNLQKELNLRVAINKETGLNIIPSDYVAKAIVRAFQNDDVKELNIVHSKSTPLIFFLKHMAHQLGFNGVQFVDKKPADMNTLEKLFYRTVGAQFDGYINTPKHEFDVKPLRKLLHDIEEPSIMDDFDNLYAFALANDFKDL